MSIRTLQNAFNGGEVAPYLYGRIDDTKFQMGCATLKNFICRVQGPAVRRTGFEFVEQTKYGDRKVRLIPFRFNSDQTCVIELGDHYARFHSFGMTVYRNGAIHEITTPYDAADLDEIEYAQSADVITLVHTKYPPQALERHSDGTGVYFTIAPIQFSLPIGSPTNVAATNTYTGQTGDGINPTRYKVYYVVTALKDTTDGTIESTASAKAEVSCNLYLNDSSNTISWTAVPGADRYRVYKTYSGLYGYIGETDGTSFVDNNKEADDGVTPPRWDDIFNQASGITEVTVTNQGSGYMAQGAVGTTTLGPSIEGLGSGSGVSPVVSTSLGNIASGDFLTGMVLVGGNPPTLPTFRIFDAAGAGAGAVGELIYTREKKEISTEVGGGDNGYATVTTDAYYLSITGVRITTSGSSYVKPQITLTGRDGYMPFFNSMGSTSWDYETITRTFDLDLDPRSPSVGVSDPTGKGATLVPVVNNGKIVSVRVVTSGSGYTNPTVVITSGQGGGATATATWGNSGDYPGAVGYFDQRKVYAGTLLRPRMMWLSCPGSENDFSYRIPVQDSDRIKFNVAAQEAGRINHLVPLSQLIATTPSTELRIQSVNSDALSPTSFSVKPQAYVGASFVHPQVFNSVMLYVAERGSHIRELGYSNQAGGFTTGDLSVRATHLFDNDQVIDIAMAKAPDQILWAVTRSGKLLGMTYMPDQNVAGWHRHETDGQFESICVVPEGDEDILYAVVSRNINGATVRYVERMHERALVALEDSFYVDCGIKKTFETETAEITGLLPLKGKTVSILADGGALPNQTVSAAGTLTLPVPTKKVIIGLPYASDLQTLPAAYQSQDGSYARGHVKNINKVWVRVYRSSGIFIGPTFDLLTERKSRQNELYGVAPELTSDEVELAVSPAWQRNGQLCIRQTYPLPLTVVGITADFAQ